MPRLRRRPRRLLPFAQVTSPESADAPTGEPESAAADMPPGRVLGLDLGDARIGVALSNPDRTISSPLEVIRRSPQLPQEIANLMSEWEAVGLVVGLPLSLDGSIGPAARKAQAEADKLAATLRVPVETYDERLTTVTAERMMSDAGLDTKSQRKVVDKIAASILLQAWLDTEAHTRARNEVNPQSQESADDPHESL